MRLFSKVRLKKNISVCITDIDNIKVEGVLLKTFYLNDKWIIIQPSNPDKGDWMKINMLFVRTISISNQYSLKESQNNFKTIEIQKVKHLLDLINKNDLLHNHDKHNYDDFYVYPWYIVITLEYLKVIGRDKCDIEEISEPAYIKEILKHAEKTRWLNSIAKPVENIQRAILNTNITLAHYRNKL